MTETAIDRMRKVKSILVTQEVPTDLNSPYLKLAEKFNLKIDFRPFIQVEPVGAKEFRKQKIEILNHTAVIFTSRNAVDHFFHIAQELKLEMPPEMKYFCISDQTSNYLQKYIVIRKRKIFTGLKNAHELLEIIKLNPGIKDVEPTPAQLKPLHACIKKVTEDLGDFMPVLADTLEQAARLRPSVVGETAGTRLMRVAVWPLAIVLSWASVAEKGGAASRAWGAVDRLARIAVKRLVVRPALLTLWMGRVIGGKMRRASRYGARWTATLPARIVRRLRRARYYVAVRIRGEAHAGADGNDTHG